MGARARACEIIVDQFKRKAKQQATTFPFPNLLSMLCMWAACPLSRPLDSTVHDNSVITLATKIDKQAPVIKAKMHENQLVQLPKALPSMIQGDIKKLLQPSKDKMASLCSTVDVLESEVVYDVDPSWTPGGAATTSYHKLHTLLDNWVVQGPEKPLALPPNP
ncbi:hypothetical protein HAX54_017285 [Datura stramonium]|uniref:Uncharacterized protein n=1 Tax=Datura stramonium TaxID=4076 RepID=A0ABS8S0A9_DATST|nr:hypothetical protein [Datura stramonium]